MKRLSIVCLLMFFIPAHQQGQGSYVGKDTSSIEECIADNFREIDSLYHEARVNEGLLKYRDSIKEIKTIAP